MTSPPGQDPTRTALILAEKALAEPRYYRNEDGETDFWRCPQGWGSGRTAALTAIQAALRNHGQGETESIGGDTEVERTRGAHRADAAEPNAPDSTLGLEVAVAGKSGSKSSPVGALTAERAVPRTDGPVTSPIPGLSSPQGQAAEEAQRALLSAVRPKDGGAA